MKKELKNEDILRMGIAVISGLAIRELSGIHGVAGFLILLITAVILDRVLSATLFKKRSTLRTIIGFIILLVMGMIYVVSMDRRIRGF